MKNNLLKRIGMKTILPLVFAVGLGSCGESEPQFYCFKERDGLRFSTINKFEDLSYGTMGTKLNIHEIEGKGTLFLVAYDRAPEDGRFDKIELIGVPKGHKIEKYANLDSINSVYKELRETGNCISR